MCLCVVATLYNCIENCVVNVNKSILCYLFLSTGTAAANMVSRSVQSFEVFSQIIKETFRNRVSVFY